MLSDLTFPCYLTTFSGKKCLSGKVVCVFFCPAYRRSPVKASTLAEGQTCPLEVKHVLSFLLAATMDFSQVWFFGAFKDLRYARIPGPRNSQKMVTSVTAALRAVTRGRVKTMRRFSEASLNGRVCFSSATRTSSWGISERALSRCPTVPSIDSACSFHQYDRGFTEQGGG
jgi:hypothetical protein